MTGMLGKTGIEDTLNQLVTRFEATTGRTGVKAHAPVPMMRAMALVMRPFKPVIAAQIQTSIVMDTRDMRFDATRARQRYPSIVPTGLDAMIRRDYARA